MSGATKDYDFGPKRHWRRWVWNRISERTEPATALCVYLAGAEDHDRRIARAAGFKDANLIAVERSASAVERLRGRRTLTVSGDLFDVVDQLSCGRDDVGVVCADLCSGLTLRALQSISVWMLSPKMFNTVFAFNMLRGRDPETKGLRSAHAAQMQGHATEKHRGVVLWRFAVVSYLRCQLRAHGQDDSNVDVVNRHLPLALHLSRPSFHTYRSTSGTQHFDSVVFVHPEAGAPLDDTAPEYLRWYRREVLRELRAVSGDDTGAAAARRSLAAVLAHRTMRMHENAHAVTGNL